MFCRIKEELGGPERSQEAVAIGWQRFRQLTAQFSAGQFCSGCYLSSFLSLFPVDPQRRTTEVNTLLLPSVLRFHMFLMLFFKRRCRLLRELATTCPTRNREGLQAAYVARPPFVSPFLRILRANAASRLLSCGHSCLCRYMHIIRSFAGGRDAAPATGSGIANALDDDRLQSLEDMRAHWPSVVDLALNAFPGA